MNKNLRKRSVAGLLLIAAFLSFSSGQQAHAKAGKVDDISRKISDIYTSLVGIENKATILSDIISNRTSEGKTFASYQVNSVSSSAAQTSVHDFSDAGSVGNVLSLRRDALLAKICQYAEEVIKIEKFPGFLYKNRADKIA